jgi:hypothetical protein
VVNWPPEEAWHLGEGLAAILDSGNPAELPWGRLLIHKVIVQFRDPMLQSDAETKLRKSVIAWPHFDISIDTSGDLDQADTVTPGGMETILTAGDVADDSVQQLASLLYELLGGVASSKCAPLASLGEKGNGVLQQGILNGMMDFFGSSGISVGFRS